MRKSRRNEEILIWTDLNVHGGLWQFVLTDFGFVAPIPHEQASIIRVSQRDQEVIPRREKHSFDSIFVPLQVLNLSIRDGLFNRDDLWLCLLLRVRSDWRGACSSCIGSFLVQLWCRTRISLPGWFRLLVLYFPYRNLWQSKRTLARRKIFTVLRKPCALEGTWRARGQKLDLLCISRRVYNQARASQIANISICGIDLKRVCALAWRSNNLLELHL